MFINLLCIKYIQLLKIYNIYYYVLIINIDFMFFFLLGNKQFLFIFATTPKVLNDFFFCFWMASWTVETIAIEWNENSASL